MSPTKLIMRMLAFAGIFGMYIDDPAGGGGTPPPPSPRPPEPETFSKDYVRELREENKGWRLKASEQETAAKTHKEAAEKAAKEADERVAAATKASNDRIIRAELKASALKAGMVDLDGLKLADLTKVTLDDKGEVQGADALMDELKKSKPYLFGAASSSNGKPAPKPGDPTPKHVRDMTDAEFAAAEAALLKDD
jgi:hypothetical protein